MLLVAAKLLLAARLDLFGDEAFYWQAAKRPAIGYVDHPPLTATMIRAGTALLGDTTLGVRLLFLLAGLLFPLVVLAFAWPLVGRRDAWLAAGATAVIPGFAHLGLLAVPDVPMLLFVAAFLLAFERATRTGSRLAWILAGVAGALGLVSHYRFVLAPASALAYLLLTPNGRARWRTAGPWLAVPILLSGFLPALIVNLRGDFASATYHLSGRHDGTFRPDGIVRFLVEQAAIASPAMWIALVCALVGLVRLARAGDDRAALAALFSGLPLAVFLLARPFERTGMDTEHWPVPAYVPLLPFVPGLVRDWTAAGKSAWRRIAGRLVPGLGALSVTLGLAGISGAVPYLSTLHKGFLGWTDAALMARDLLDELHASGREVRIVAGDDYKVAAELEFHLGADVEVFSLGGERDLKHGRAAQIEAWGLDERSLHRRHGEDVLVVVRWSDIRERHREPWLDRVRKMFRTLEPMGELERADPGARHVRFGYYLGSGLEEE